MSTREHATVSNLINKKFSCRTIEERLAIKELGRPQPDLDISQSTTSQKRVFKRVFNRNVYDKNEWLCGCEVRNAFFCFPCLLFSSVEDAWTKGGVKDLGHLSQKVKKHESSKQHLSSQLDLKMLGNTDIGDQLDVGHRLFIQKHNDNVDKNRYVLKKIINAILFCGSFELPLRGHDETESSVNPGVFRGLIDYSSELDNALKNHLQTATVFKGTSKDIQNELLDCILRVTQNYIIREIGQGYVSVIADETTDVSAMSQMVIVFRYIVNSAPVERFWTFVQPQKHDAVTLATEIKTILKAVVHDPENLVAQSYDGAAVMSGSRGGVQKIIREEYPYANFVHCYAHQINLILTQATSQHTQARVFFMNLSAFPGFFSNSPQRMAVLDEVVKRRLPRGVATRWNFQLRTVNVVHENKQTLIECLEILEESSLQASTVNQAKALRSYLEDPQFIYWLDVFHLIMPHVEILYKKLQLRSLDSVKVKSVLDEFRRAMQDIREHQLSKIVIHQNGQFIRKRKCDDSLSTSVAAKEVCDVIITQMTSRFAFTGHLSAGLLLSAENYEQYQQKFPEDVMAEAINSYPFFQEARLRTELELLHSRHDMKSVTGAVHLLSLISNNNLNCVFEEVSKLARLVASIPMTSSEAERCFSTLKRIKTFLRSTMKEDRLSALGMISIEKDLISKIPNFLDAVVEEFCQRKERRMEFQYRK